MCVFRMWREPLALEKSGTIVIGQYKHGLFSGLKCAHSIKSSFVDVQNDEIEWIKKSVTEHNLYTTQQKKRNWDWTILPFAHRFNWIHIVRIRFAVFTWSFCNHREKRDVETLLLLLKWLEKNSRKSSKIKYLLKQNVGKTKSNVIKS